MKKTGSCFAEKVWYHCALKHGLKFGAAVTLLSPPLLNKTLEFCQIIACENCRVSLVSRALLGFGSDFLSHVCTEPAPFRAYKSCEMKLRLSLPNCLTSPCWCPGRTDEEESSFCVCNYTLVMSHRPSFHRACWASDLSLGLSMCELG